MANTGMIDTQARRVLAKALRNYLLGRRTNDELDAVPVGCLDRGPQTIKAMAWHLYSDTHRHYVGEELSRGSELRGAVVRWMAFLYSDEAYTWPEFWLIQCFNWPMNLLTLGWWERRKQARWLEFCASGSWESWPFSTNASYQRALARPRFLSGRK